MGPLINKYNNSVSSRNVKFLLEKQVKDFLGAKNRKASGNSLKKKCKYN